MSAAAPTADAGAVAPAKKGKKKLIIIIAAALLVVLIGAGAAMFLMKKKAHDAEGAEDGAPTAEHAAAKRDPKHPPTFLPLDPFVVNLADKEVDRYAQIGITLEVADAKFAEDMKTYMPAIRNGILMILAHKNSRELLERSGKEKLAGQIQREAARTMGIEVDEPDEEDAPIPAGHGAAKEPTKATAVTADDEEEDPPKKGAKASKKTKKVKAAVENPIHHVHFSNFIVQ